MMVLRALHSDEFAAYAAYFVPDYAADLVANHGLTERAAMAKAQGDLDSAFPKGPVSPGQSLLAIVLNAALIGYLWYEMQATGTVAFVQDFHILPKFQGRGLAKAAMAEFEAQLRGAGVSLIRLRVAPDNPVARHVYEAGGFRMSGINMYKTVE